MFTEVTLRDVRRFDQFLYNWEYNAQKIIAIVRATEELSNTLQVGLEMEYVQILLNTTQVELKPGDKVPCGQQNLVCWVEQKHVDPIKPDRFSGTLTPTNLKNYPYPAHLGVALMESQGYLFGGTEERYFEENFQVPIFNVGMLIGYITYVR